MSLIYKWQSHFVDMVDDLIKEYNSLNIIRNKREMAHIKKLISAIGYLNKVSGEYSNIDGGTIEDYDLQRQIISDAIDDCLNLKNRLNNGEF